jgi:hypothetical protein
MPAEIDRSSFKQALLDHGWSKDEDMFVHPADKELNLWCNPYNGEVLLSPKLVEHLKSLSPVINLFGESAQANA